MEGEDPMKAEEVTDDQLSVIYSVVQAGIAPYADFGVWRPLGQRVRIEHEICFPLPHRELEEQRDPPT